MNLKKTLLQNFVANTVDSPMLAGLLEAKLMSGMGVDPRNVPGVANAPSDINGIIAMGKKMAAKRGWTGDEWDALYQLWQQESGWNPKADNPSSSAFGIPQALTELHGLEGTPYMNNPRAQIRWGLNYLRDRYGKPSNALAGYEGGNLGGPRGY